jgi:hypothetical protein
MLGTLGIGTPIKIGLAVVSLAVIAWLVDDYAWQRTERARLERAVAEAVAANQSLVQALDDAAAEHAAAVAALQAAGAAEREARAQVEALLEQLRHAPPEDDRDLSPTAQQFFDRLRGGP